MQPHGCGDLSNECSELATASIGPSLIARGLAKPVDDCYKRFRSVGSPRFPPESSIYICRMAFMEEFRGALTGRKKSFRANL
jgi:hypothetical protein